MKHIHDIWTININNPQVSTLVSSHTSQGRTPYIREDSLEEKKKNIAAVSSSILCIMSSTSATPAWSYNVLIWEQSSFSVNTNFSCWTGKFRWEETIYGSETNTLTIVLHLRTEQLPMYLSNKHTSRDAAWAGSVADTGWCQAPCIPQDKVPELDHASFPWGPKN